MSVPELPAVARHGQIAPDLEIRHGNDKNEKDAWSLQRNRLSRSNADSGVASGRLERSGVLRRQFAQRLPTADPRRLEAFHTDYAQHPEEIDAAIAAEAAER